MQRRNTVLLPPFLYTVSSGTLYPSHPEPHVTLDCVVKGKINAKKKFKNGVYVLQSEDYHTDVLPSSHFPAINE